MSNQVTIDALAAWLKVHDDIVLIGHINPDGDAAGSCIGMALALRALGKRTFVCLPGGLAKMYASFPCSVEVVSSEAVLPFVPKTAFVLDVSEPERLGSARGLFEDCTSRAVLDHHGTNPGFGEVCYIDGDASATGEIVVALIEALGVVLTQEMALWLFVAISTDCGQFAYSNTRAESLEATAKLLRAGVDVAAVTQQLYRTRSRARTQLLGRALAGLEVSEDGKIAWTRLTEQMFSEVGALREDNEGVVNYLLEIDGVEIAVLAEERGTATKFSLRSKTWVDVAKDVAGSFGGGGHARAAGCTLQMPMEEALQKVLHQAKQALASK